MARLTGSTTISESTIPTCEFGDLPSHSVLNRETHHSLSETPDAIADHVLALYSAKLLAYTKHDPEKLVIDLEKITTENDRKENGKEGAVFIHTSKAGVTVTEGPGATVENR